VFFFCVVRLDVNLRFSFALMLGRLPEIIL
jgi:hypothetical protein